MILNTRIDISDCLEYALIGFESDTLSEHLKEDLFFIVESSISGKYSKKILVKNGIYPYLADICIDRYASLTYRSTQYIRDDIYIGGYSYEEITDLSNQFYLSNRLSPMGSVFLRRFLECFWRRLEESIHFNLLDYRGKDEVEIKLTKVSDGNRSWSFNNFFNYTIFDLVIS